MRVAGRGVGEIGKKNSKGKKETEGARFWERDRKAYGKRKKRRKVSAGLGAEGKNREWAAESWRAESKGEITAKEKSEELS